VRPRLAQLEADADVLGVAFLQLDEHVLILLVARAEDDELDVLVQELRRDLGEQVEPLLVREPGHDA
jgi:hypothetical protein